jgi:hypothetical protein
MPVKSGSWRVDGSSHMSNELIDVINSARASGNDVKVIRRQKYDPNNFYMTLVQGGKQVGPVKVQGDASELNRKFGEAQSYLAGMKSSPAKSRAAAA